MPRGARLDAPGTLHHVMIRGIKRRTLPSYWSQKITRLSRKKRNARHTMQNDARCIENGMLVIQQCARYGCKRASGAWKNFTTS